MPKHILCKVSSYTPENEPDGDQYTVYDNNTFIHSCWVIENTRRIPMKYKIEDNFFYYSMDGGISWMCDCQDGSYNIDDLYLISAIEEAIEKKFLLGDDDE